MINNKYYSSYIYILQYWMDWQEGHCFLIISWYLNLLLCLKSFFTPVFSSQILIHVWINYQELKKETFFHHKMFYKAEVIVNEIQKNWSWNHWYILYWCPASTKDYTITLEQLHMIVGCLLRIFIYLGFKWKQRFMHT